MASAESKPTKNQLRRAKKKAQKVEVRFTIFLHPTLLTISKSSTEPTPDPSVTEAALAPKPTTNDDSTIPDTSAVEQKVHENGLSVNEPLVLDASDPLYDMYKDIMDKFEEADKEDPALKEPEKPEVYYDDDDDIPDEDEEAAVPKMSKKKRKEQNKLSVAELKALVKKPETVDWTDTSASDPRLLVHIKAYRNVVPVPSHWSLKREYLSSKRGVEKPPFALPKFIQETGIAEMRDAVLEKQDQASLKQKQRERVAPKMGKLDIDYQKLYEAFFRFQTKPELTRYGEVYYEGKEYETNLRHLRPGELSDELKDA
jgi:splicing factor 3B subunit 2